MQQTVLVGVGGLLGSCARYWVGALAYRWLPSSLPYATALVNVSGCFLIGFLAALADQRALISPSGRLFWLVGVLGGYTTFSSFAYETITLAGQGRVGWAVLNVLAQVIAGLLAVSLGAVLGRLV